ncbi:ATP-binding protein [Enterococcus dispar]|uniref:ATP-binding protein n=1 Tax=Enterococcus dispar TaxID=44009 RepID=UPI0021D469CE|nr:ATP-binding protein [Enterococcus dispar]MCU7356560.1 ATP-binding protein [Enterococcus dispar]
MFQLPPNKPQTPKDTPRNYFIWGETMSGKSYLASEFPNPIILNTDGNAEANSVPSIQIRNVKNKDGSIIKGAPEQIGEVILALQTQSHSYETVVLDVIDDIIEMIKQYVQINHNVKSLGEIKWGKGWDEFNGLLTEMVIDLKTLPMNVVYISRQLKIVEENSSYDAPSLKDKYVNLINGNSDLNIQTKKLGNKYIRRVEARRKSYQREQVDDSKILAILDTITGVFDRTQRTTRQEQDKIASNITKQQEARLEPKENKPL